MTCVSGVALQFYKSLDWNEQSDDEQGLGEDISLPDPARR